MSEQDKKEILEAFMTLPEDKKAFVAGYAMGLADRGTPDEKKADPDEKGQATA